jgi:SAM-dependent methyltransferase
MPRMSRLQQTSQRLFGALIPRMPRPIKRWVRRSLPRRYRGYFDRDWHRHTMGVAQQWEKLGKLQLEFLVEHGLPPTAYFLDVGCGPLRAGVHFIRYLEPGHYFGIDRRADVLEVAKDVELPRYGLVDKRPILVEMDDFDFERLGQTFDYALAQSVFTHLPINKIMRCVVSIEKVLAPGGKFFATIYLNERGKLNLDQIQQTPRIVSNFDRNPYHYDLATFEWICDGTGLTPEYLGDWNSPRNQKMLVITRR